MTDKSPPTKTKTVSKAAPKKAPAKNEPAKRATGIKATGLPDDVVFYCKDCDKVTSVNRVGRRYVYTCTTCGTKNVAFGTEKSIYSFFHLDKEEKKKSPKEPEKVTKTESKK